MKRPTKAGISQLSPKSADKLMACLCHNTNVGSAAYVEHPDYYNACARWHADLTAEQKETVLVVVDALTHARREAAEKIADSLPNAPRCPP